MGTLYIVSTPIGNLGDITLRALETLKSVDLVVCEDTRVSGRLLKHFEIEKRMLAVNDFNEERQVGKVVSEIQSGTNVALISDAGTPLVSDPGYKLVRTAIQMGIKVVAIPGVSAPIAALTISGLAPDKFMFLGYLPKKDGKKKEILSEVKQMKDIEKFTAIFIDSPYRAIYSLNTIYNFIGDLDIVIFLDV